MRVRQVLGSGARRETYTLVDDKGRVVELVDDYLALRTDREHSPNTLRARAYDLKEWLTFLRLLAIVPLAGIAVPLPRPATAATSVGPGPPAAASSGALRRHALAVQGIRASRSPD